VAVPELADAFSERIKARLLIKLGIDPSSFDWTADRAISDVIASICPELELLSEQIAQSAELDPYKQTGSKLLSVCRFKNYTPYEGTKSTCAVRLTNSTSVVQLAAKGNRCRSGVAPDVIYWLVMEDVQIPANSYVDVYVESERKGAYYVDVGAINQSIDNSRFTVVNTEDDIRASLLESNMFSVFGNVDALKDLVKRVNGVVYVSISSNENTTSRTVGTIVIPPGSFAVAVYPPNLTEASILEIADIIYSMMPPATGIALPSDSSEGALLTKYGDEVDQMDVGVFWSVRKTVRVRVAIVLFDNKPNGTGAFTAAELSPAVKSAVTQYVSSVNRVNSTGSVIIIQRIEGVCVKIKGCASVVVSCSVNGGSYDTQNVVIDPLEYIELLGVTVV
jgi:hypothetical protein